MKTWIFRLSLAVELLLPLLSPGQIVNSSSRGTEIFTSPKAPVPKNPSQMYIATFLEYAVGTLRKHHDANLTTGLPDGFHYSIRQWEQLDITNFAGCPKTFDLFETLLGIGNQAVEKGRDGRFTAKAIEAQNALTYLMPICCKSWRGFCNMIAIAADETQVRRDRWRKEVKDGKHSFQP